MSKVRFELGFGARAHEIVDLPIEIRSAGLSLVERVLASEGADLAPGTYHVVARLPAGQEVHREITIEEGRETPLVRLEPEGDDDSRAHSPQRSRDPGSGLTTSALEATECCESPFELRWFCGNPLMGTCRSDEDLVIEGNPPDEVTVGTRASAATTRYVQVSQPGEPTVNVALPLCPGTVCRVSFPRLPGGGFPVEVHLGHATADLLAEYLRHGLLAEAAITARSETLHEDRLLPGSPPDLARPTAGAQSAPDPVAAAVRAYAILRAGEPERIRHWTAKLAGEFPWLPDGAAIHGEVLARIGEHGQAFELLLHLRERGLPVFSDGVSYALDRLAVYATVRADGLSEVQQARASDLLATLRRFAISSGAGQTYTNYLAHDPNQPDPSRAPPLRSASFEQGIESPELTCRELLARGFTHAPDLQEILDKEPGTSVRDAIAAWVYAPGSGIQHQLARVARGQRPNLDPAEFNLAVGEAVLDLVDHVQRGKPVLTSLPVLLTRMTKARAAGFALAQQRMTDEGSSETAQARDPASDPTGLQKRMTREAEPIADTDALKRAFARLKPSLRAMIRLVDLEELTTDQAAEQLDIPEQQARADYRRARELLMIGQSAWP